MLFYLQNKSITSAVRPVHSVTHLLLNERLVFRGISGLLRLRGRCLEETKHKAGYLLPSSLEADASVAPPPTHSPPNHMDLSH